MTSRTTKLRRPAMVLLAACFFMSAISRIGNPDGALAYEVQKLTSQGAATPADASPTDASPTDADLNLLVAAVREREQQLDQRALNLAEKSKVIEAAEAKLKAQLEQLESAEDRLAKLIRVADKASEKDVDMLIGVYQAMGGKSAGPIFETMDAAFAAGLLSRMDGDPAAAILGSVSPEKAYEITVMIAAQNAKAPE